MKAHVLALFTILVWSTTFVATKVLLAAGLTPLWILVIRFALGFAALSCLRPHRLRLANPRDGRLFAAAGLTGVACYFLLENVALTFTSATAVGAICATSPLFCALIALARGQRPASPVGFAVGFVLAMGGILLVGTASGGSAFTGSAADNLFGCGLAFIASLVWAVYSTLVSRIAEAGYETLAATKRIFAWGLLFMIPALPFAGAFPAEALGNPLAVANLLFLGLGASAACFATWNFAVKHLGAVVTSTYIYLVPALTGAASALVLGEPVTAPIVAGVALTIAGLMLSNRTKSPCKLHRSTPATQPDKAFLCRKLR
ncbi:DMT family transporter [Adlercreutzia equolifaciens]|uniref:DMT family transporter n=1 Tax=Adlercreutzia equolifaciens TaxID=446660 RepID=UPI0024311210|nr:DMT family transporter [Adlercreutzia equolifaciens]